MKLSGVVQNLVTVVVVTAPLSAQATGREVDSKPSDLTFVAALGGPTDASSLWAFRAALEAAHSGTGERGFVNAKRWSERGGLGLAGAGGVAPGSLPDVVFTTAPEPATAALLATGLVLLGAGTMIRRLRARA